MRREKAFELLKEGYRIHHKKLGRNVELYLRGGRVKDTQGYAYVNNGINLMQNETLKIQWEFVEPDMSTIVKGCHGICKIFKRLDDITISRYKYYIHTDELHREKNLRGKTKEQIDNIFIHKVTMDDYLFIDEVSDKYRDSIINKIKYEESKKNENSYLPPQ